MTRTEAKRASQTLEDVFTPKGDAVTIARLYTFSDPAAELYGKGQCAQVNGVYDYAHWYPISELTTSTQL